MDDDGYDEDSGWRHRNCARVNRKASIHPSVNGAVDDPRNESYSVIGGGRRAYNVMAQRGQAVGW